MKFRYSRNSRRFRNPNFFQKCLDFFRAIFGCKKICFRKGHPTFFAYFQPTATGSRPIAFPTTMSLKTSQPPPGFNNYMVRNPALKTMLVRRFRNHRNYRKPLAPVHESTLSTKWAKISKISKIKSIQNVTNFDLKQCGSFKFQLRNQSRLLKPTIQSLVDIFGILHQKCRLYYPQRDLRGLFDRLVTYHRFAKEIYSSTQEFWFFLYVKERSTFQNCVELLNARVNFNWEPNQTLVLDISGQVQARCKDNLLFIPFISTANQENIPISQNSPNSPNHQRIKRRAIIHPKGPVPIQITLRYQAHDPNNVFDYKLTQVRMVSTLLDPWQMNLAKLSIPPERIDLLH